MNTLSVNQYPTKQEIIDRMETMNVTQYEQALQNWKDRHYCFIWRKKSIQEKIKSLESLAYLIYYHQDQPSKLKTLYVIYADRYALHTKTNTIILNESKPSILSTLHEVGHSINGTSETEACAFSVKLFAKLFPKEYSKLKWRGHMLKLPT